MLKQAVAYLRVSGKGQVEGHGFDRQEEEVRAYCKASGYDLLAVYREEGVSGTADESDRPAFQEMVSNLLSNGCRTIIVEGLDRLAREMRIQEALLLYLAAKKLTLIAARTGENVTEAVMDDPMRKALVQMQGVFSELEKSLLVKKLAKARAAKKAKAGKCEGRKSLVEANPKAFSLIRKLHNAQVKYAAIAAELNAKALLTQTGKTWTAGGVQQAVFKYLSK